MRPPIFIRPLTDDERAALHAGLRSPDAFTLRRCQILLASAQGKLARDIAADLHCDDQTVRTAIHAFNATGLAALTPGSHVAHTRPHAAFDAQRLSRLARAAPPQPAHLWPRHRASGRWTCSPRRPSPQGLTAAPRQRRSHPRRAQAPGHLAGSAPSTGSPVPTRSTPKKTSARPPDPPGPDAPGWALGFEDETWWSRVTQPRLHTWARRARRCGWWSRRSRATSPKRWPATGCCGATWTRSGDAIWLRFVDGRPLSGVTTAFLDWCCAQLAAQGKTAWLLVWDRAPWHESQAVRTWIRRAQPAGQAGHGAGADRELSLAEQEPVAEPDRAALAARQAGGGRADARAERPGTARPGVCLLWMYAEPHLTISDYAA